MLPPTGGGSRRGGVCFLSVARQISNAAVHHASGVAANHGDAEIGERVHVAWRARVVWLEAAGFGGEAEGRGQFEAVERRHHAIEPAARAGPKPIGPAQARTEPFDSQLFQPLDGAVEARILEVEPLADAERRRELTEPPKRELRGAVFSQQSHVEMPV